MSPLYHLAPLRLAPGSVILPGNFGRLLKRYMVPAGGNAYGNPWMLAREMAFELVRSQVAADKPSRMHCAFALLSEEDAKRYADTHDIHYTGVLHRVELQDPSLPTHLGSLSLLEIPQNGAPFTDPTLNNAHEYWSGRGEGPRELLTMSPLRVVDCLM